MKKEETQQPVKRSVKQTLTRVATTCTMLCTTLMVLAPLLEGGAGPKLPKSFGE